MGRNSTKILLIAVFMVGAGYVGAQDHRFMVFFSDKNSAFSLNQPQAFLSQRALDRRANQNISLSEEDLPVNPDYLQALRDLNVTVRFATKWFNGALVETDSSNLNSIEALSFVTTIEHVAPGPLIPQNGKSKTPKSKNPRSSSAKTQSTDFQNQILGIDDMHSLDIKGEGMLIAVFDGGFSGVNSAAAFDHLFSNNQLTGTYDFVGDNTDVFRYDDHGTRALSVIAGNETGVFTGGAYEADYMLFVTEDVSSEYRVEEYNWTFAAEYADSSGVDIINTSLGYNTFDDPSMNYTPDDIDGETAIISRAATIAATKGMVLTVSAGNSGNSLWEKITAPADALGVLAVGAIATDSTKASFSSFGPSADGRIKPDIVALGVSTALINSQGNLVFNNGTSFSSPQIASLVAGYWQANPDLTSAEIITSLKNSGSMAQNPDNELGFGIPNFTRAGQVVLSTDDNPLGDLIKLFPNPLDKNLFLLSQEPMATATITMHNLSGQKIIESHLSNIPANQNVRIDLPPLIRGVYLLTFVNKNSKSTFKVIKY